MKTLVLGIGNEILSDDAVGLKVVERLERELKAPDVELKQTGVTSVELLDLLVGFDRVIIVDAIKTATGRPGHVRVMDQADLGPQTTPTSLHHVGLPNVLAIGKTLGLKMPEHVRIFAIEAKDVSAFGGPCCPEVEAAIPKVIDLIRAELDGSARRLAQLEEL